MRKKYLNGFTLIELLVVVAIIGLLPTIVLSSLNSARAKARDAQVKIEFNQIQKALTLYFDKYGKYPNEVPVGGQPWTDNFNSMAAQLVTEKFLGSVPVAPANHIYSYYNYGGNVVGGILVSTLETITPTAAVPPPTCKPFNTGNWCDTSYVSQYYCICNPY